MKNMNQFRIWILLIVFSTVLLHSCEKKNDPIPTNYQNFISSKTAFDIASEESKIRLTFLQFLYPETAAFADKAVNDIQVQKVIYKTIYKDGNIQASGLVCLPKTAGNYPILCFQNGTITLHSEAPTVNPKDDMLSILESVASMGFIVVIPDYIGFGESSNLPHPYLHAESTIQSALDLLTAVKELTSEDKIAAKPTKDLYLFGYSQGGWSTMQLQKTIEKNYPTEYNLVASSCGAGPYSIEYMTNYILAQTNYPMPYFIGYLLNAYNKVGEVSNPLSDFFQASYAAKIPGLFDGLHSSGTINSELTTKISDLITPEFRSEFETNSKFAMLKSAFIANSVTPWKINTPTRLYHGGNDNYIPVGMSEKFLADVKTAGTTNDKIQLIVIPGFDHAGGVVPVGLETISWFLELKK